MTTVTLSNLVLVIVLLVLVSERSVLGRNVTLGVLVPGSGSRSLVISDVARMVKKAITKVC